MMGYDIPIDEQVRKLTWECRAGTMGTCQVPGPDGRSLDIPVLYQGCGIIEPRVAKVSHFQYALRGHCACEQEARRQWEEADRRQKQWQERKKTAYAWLGDRWADMGHARKTFESFRRDLQPEAYDLVRGYACDPTGTLILAGPCGIGKTHLLAALCNEAAMREKKSLRSHFATAPKLFHAIQERIGENTSYMPLIRSAITIPLLVIDDIDKAQYSKFREEVYFDIIDGRANEDRPIAISTNRLADLSQFVGIACASRLSIRQIAVEMTGEDYRPLIS